MHKKMTECSGKHPRLHELILHNIRIARRKWLVSAEQIEVLSTLTKQFHFSVPLGDIQLLNTKWYVTHSGLMRLARRNRCAGINVRSIGEFCEPASSRWVFKAIAYRSATSKGFVGYGDADPSNVSSLVHGAEMRVAETRAVNRALRKAYGIGLCSVEELGSPSGSPTSTVGSAPPHRFHAPDPPSNGHHPRLRDQLCLLIRQHNLDPALVKAYAADFCGTQTLKDASRDLVESFISHIAKAAKEDRDALVCKLNSYAQTAEANP